MSTYDDGAGRTAPGVPEGYDRLTARDAIAWLRGLPLHELEDLRAYEERGKARSTVIAAIDVRLDELEGPIVLPARGRPTPAPAPADRSGAAGAVGTAPGHREAWDPQPDGAERPAARRSTLASLAPAPPSAPFQEVAWPEYDDGRPERRRWPRGTVALVGAGAALVATVGVVQPW